MTVQDYFARFWDIEFAYTPAQPAARTPGIVIGDVDANGHIGMEENNPFVRGAQPADHFLYDHQARWWDDTTLTLGMQDSLLKIDVMKDYTSQVSKTLQIDEQELCIHWSWDYSYHFMWGGKQEAKVERKGPPKQRVRAGELGKVIDASGMANGVALIAWLRSLGYSPPEDVPVAELRARPLGAYTVIIKWAGALGHHGIVVPASYHRTGQSGVIIGHFLQGSQPGKWFNRDQIWEKEDEARSRSLAQSNALVPVQVPGQALLPLNIGRLQPAVFFDTLEQFLGRGSRNYDDASVAVVLFPSVDVFNRYPQVPGNVA
jgi:hypothetical protein